jgi:predicted Rossmann fold flavoprotein
MSIQQFDVIVLGGGASGFFAAIHAADGGKNKVLILEKSNKLLSKVKISGGGRCNVTHDIPHINALCGSYPRGGKSLKRAFAQFDQNNTIAWFQSRGVPLKTEADGRVFPKSDQSQSIIQALTQAAENAGVRIHLSEGFEALEKSDLGYTVVSPQNRYQTQYVVFAMGGHAKQSFYTPFREMHLAVANPIPSLFTFNVPNSPAKALMGLSVPHGSVRIPGTKWKQEGPILITHWGFSAPAVILLSAWAALDLHQRQYQFPIEINWLHLGEEEVRNRLETFATQHRLKKISNQNPFGLASRLWAYLMERAEIPEQQQWHDVAKKQRNKLIKHLVSDNYQVNGKTTFKEEFVSCGGIELENLNLQHFEITRQPNTFAIGELIHVDGITGGFNFQHAWTSGYVCGTEIARRLQAAR